MMDNADDAVAIGIAAWSRLRDHDRASWSDWLSVARALAVGRTAALKTAATNKCVGSKYNAAMGAWLSEHGLADVVAQERYRLLLILQNIEAIEAWRAGLDEGQRRRLNHPNSVWSHWRRSTQDATRAAPARRAFVKTTMPSHKNGKPIFWPQAYLRRGADAFRECPSKDVYVLIRFILERTIRSENDLIELLDDVQQHQASKAKAPAATMAAHALLTVSESQTA